MDDAMKFHQTWHLHQLSSFYQQFLFIFYSVYKNKPRGVSTKDLIKFIKKNYYLDGDLCPQVTTVLMQAIDQGVIEKRGDKYHLIGPIASVQDTDPDSPERQNELKSICGVFNYNTTRGKTRSRTKVTEGGVPKLDRSSIGSAKKRCGSREKCSSVGLALQEKTLADTLQSKLCEPKISDNNRMTTPSRFIPNITVLSKIKQYFDTSACKCQARTSSKSKSNTKSSLSKPLSDTKSSINSMKTAIQNSNNHSKNSKNVSLKSHHDNSSDEYLSTHSQSDRQKDCKFRSQFPTKSPKIGSSSQGMSLQATRSKTPTQYTMLPSGKPSNIMSSESKCSDGNSKSVLSSMPFMSTLQHFLGGKECDAASDKSKVTHSTRTLRPRTVDRNCLCPQRPRDKKKSTKRLNVKFRTMGRDRCSGQFCSLNKKGSKCRTCKIRFPRPFTATSSRPCTRNTYAATRTSMRTRSSTRGRCLSAYDSKVGSLGKSSISTKSARPAKANRKGRASLCNKSANKKRKLKSRDSYGEESYWGDFCCS